MSLASNLAYMLILLGAGAAGRHTGVLTGLRVERLSQFAFYIALPAMVFASTAERTLEDVLSARLVGGALAVLALSAAAAWVVHRSETPTARRSVAVVQSYHGNLGFLGLPIVATTYGGLAAAKASLLLGALALVQIPLTITILVALNGRDTDLVSEVSGALVNPPIAALLLGLSVAAARVTVPPVTEVPLSVLGSLALPAALLSVGASLVVERGDVPPWTVGRVVALKVLLMPVLALAVFALLGADPSTRAAGVTMLAMPCAVSTFVYASELGGDTALASVDVLVTTVVSFGVVFMLTQVL